MVDLYSFSKGTNQVYYFAKKPLGQTDLIILITQSIFPVEPVQGWKNLTTLWKVCFHWVPFCCCLMDIDDTWDAPFSLTFQKKTLPLRVNSDLVMYSTILAKSDLCLKLYSLLWETVQANENGRSWGNTWIKGLPLVSNHVSDWILSRSSLAFFFLSEAHFHWSVFYLSKERFLSFQKYSIVLVWNLSTSKIQILSGKTWHLSYSTGVCIGRLCVRV